MSLLRKPLSKHGKVHDITPASAEWQYVGFAVHRLTRGDAVEENNGSEETILVLIEGKASIKAGGHDFGTLGERMNVFEKSLPHAVYMPQQCSWSANAETDCTLAVCRAPGKGTGHSVKQLGPTGVTVAERGVGSNRRLIHNIAMEDRPVADSLLVTEVFTPQGNWSSYPPHRHDKDDFPNITYLEETYYHRLNPPQGFGLQRVFTEDGSLDETLTVHDHDVVLVPRGHHPCGAPFGYEMYYLNVMAGPLRHWRFINHPDHDWITEFNPDH
ncbi:MAG: 5-deoxy-glucuronate isomerase [Rhodobacteraceae bacterium]|nr:5-deoxy-glucuronate isomerase [Paracoccaceae bacterium]